MTRTWLSLASAALLIACSDTPDTSTITETEVGTGEFATLAEERPSIPVVDTAPLRVDFDGSKSLRDNAVAGALPATYSRILASASPSGEVGEEVANLTLFVPTDEALQAMDPEDVAFLLDRDHRDSAYMFYADSAVNGRIRGEELAEAIRTSSEGVFNTATPRGSNINFRVENAQVLVSNASGKTARVVETDVTATDGIVHYIDTVLWARP